MYLSKASLVTLILNYVWGMIQKAASRGWDDIQISWRHDNQLVMNSGMQQGYRRTAMILRWCWCGYFSKTVTMTHLIWIDCNRGLELPTGFHLKPPNPTRKWESGSYIRRTQMVWAQNLSISFLWIGIVYII